MEPETCETCNGRKLIPCDECEAGETHGNHVENCDLDVCAICRENEECGVCYGNGDVECPDC